MAKRKHKGKKISYRKKSNKPALNARRVAPENNVSRLTEGHLSVQFSPHDTWFFRESRPHDAVGASELASLFPPPVRTLAGALRTHIGQCLNIDWQTMQCSQGDVDFQALFGDSEHLGQLQLHGPYLHYRGQRLYPVPLYLIHQETNLQRLTLGDAVRCDLGHVRLPKMPDGCEGYKPLENRWLTAQGMRRCLEGNVPAQSTLVEAASLIHYESRLGIARNNRHGTVEQGMLYQTRHCRPDESAQLQIELQAENLPDTVCDRLEQHNPAIVRLGGEGRMAGLNIHSCTEPLPTIDSPITESFTIHFITPADFNGQMFPEGFRPQTDEQGVHYWHGEINGIPIKIEAAIIGKAYREGGWDMARHRPRPVKSYVPAGSVWFCRLQNKADATTLKQALHGCHIGQETAWGRGQVLLGLWPQS